MMNTYIHYNNGKEYVIVDNCKIQDGLGVWVDGIIYRQVDGVDLFVRTVGEFELKFKKKNI